MVLRILIILLFLVSCSSFQKGWERRPASSNKACTDLLHGFVVPKDHHKFSLEELKLIHKSEVISKAFLKHIHDTYPLTLRRRISELANKINGYHRDRIYLNFFIELEKFKMAGGIPFPKNPKGWAKKNWAYLYVDKLGVKEGESAANFEDLARTLDYYQNELGVDNLYLLPINKSPKMDGGYDVSSYKEIDEALGGNEGFMSFIQKARERGMNVMIDFVPGHTSREHPWFKKALQGDPKYINYYKNRKHDLPFETITENGNVYNIYKTEDGQEYRRLLLFPDIEKRHWNKEGDHYFYSSFYPFQKDLDLQNPDVLEEHLSTLSFWLQNGVSGIRADAISWWVKKEGTTGQHLEESLAVSEYFHTFLKYLDEESILLPELVDSPETAARYLGHTATINGSTTGRNADAVFEFEKTVQIFYAGVSGNFKDHYKFLERTRNIPMPENALPIIYSGNHHDEIYLGFLSEGAKKDFQKRILDVGGVVYKEGNSGGAMVGDLLSHDKEKMFNFYKFLYGHRGAVALYQGSELGLSNAWDEAYKKTFTLLEEMKRLKKILPDHPVFDEIAALKAKPQLMHDPPPQGSEIRKFIDGRLLHRETITEEMIEKARSGDNEFFNLFKKLPKLKESTPALNEGGVEEPLETMRSDIGSFMRRAYDETGQLSEEVAVIKNGTAQTTTVNLSREQLTKKQNFRLFEVEKGVEIPYEIAADGESVIITMQPEETLWLRVE